MTIDPKNFKTWARPGIGASDAVTIAGADPAAWSDLRAAKLDLPRRPVPARSRRLREMGKALENLNLDLAAEAIAQGYMVSDELTMNTSEHRQLFLWHGEISFLNATLDLAYVRGPEVSLVVEAKFHSGDKDIAALAEFYMPQLQHQMMVSGTRQAWLSVLFGHYGAHSLYPVNFDPNWVGPYVERCKLFIEYVETGSPPASIFIDNESLPVANGAGGYVKRFDRASDNEVTTLCTTLIETRKASRWHDEAKEKLKEIMQAGWAKMIWECPMTGRVEVMRLKRGLRINIAEATE